MSQPNLPATGAARAIRSSGGVLAGRLVAYAASLATLIVTARQLGAGGRGTLVLVVTLTAFTTLVFTLGLPVAARLHLVDAEHPVPLPDYLGLALALSVVTGLLTPIVTALFLPVAHVHPEPRVLVAVGAYAAVNAGLYLVVAALFAYGRLISASFCDAAGYVGQGLLCVALMIGGSRSIDAFVAVLAAGMAPPVVGGLVALHRIGQPVRPAHDRTTWRSLVRTGFPSVGTVLCEGATFRVDRLILGAVASPAAVGVYSVGATAAEMVRSIPASVNQLVFYEVVMGRLKGRSLQRMRRATVAALVVLAAVGAALAPWAVRLAVGDAYAGAVTPFRVLLLAEIGFSLYFFDTTVLAGSNRVALAARAALVGVVAIVITDLALIPAFDAAGAAWASVLSYWVMAGAARALLTRHTQAH